MCNTENNCVPHNLGLIGPLANYSTSVRRTLVPRPLSEKSRRIFPKGVWARDYMLDPLLTYLVMAHAHSPPTARYATNKDIRLYTE